MDLRRSMRRTGISTQNAVIVEASDAEVRPEVWPTKRQRRGHEENNTTIRDRTEVKELERQREQLKAPRAVSKKPTAGSGPTRDQERRLWAAGRLRVAGIDEAGRGPLAGPVVAAACILPEHVAIHGIDDSKKLTEEQREAIYTQLTTHPDVEWAAEIVGVDVIDGINILQATMKAMEGCVAAIPGSLPPDFLLVDGNRLPKGFDPESSRAVVKGDATCLCIAAASIIAKVTRDRIMVALHTKHPVYGFDQHKGYGVPAHVAAIREHGPCPAHRRTFAPVKTWFPVE